MAIKYYWNILLLMLFSNGYSVNAIQVCVFKYTANISDKCNTIIQYNVCNTMLQCVYNIIYYYY